MDKYSIEAQCVDTPTPTLLTRARDALRDANEWLGFMSKSHGWFTVIDPTLDESCMAQAARCRQRAHEYLKEVERRERAAKEEQGE